MTTNNHDIATKGARLRGVRDQIDRLKKEEGRLAQELKTQLAPGTHRLGDLEVAVITFTSTKVVTETDAKATGSLSTMGALRELCLIRKATKRKIDMAAVKKINKERQEAGLPMIPVKETEGCRVQVRILSDS